MLDLFLSRFGLEISKPNRIGDDMFTYNTPDTLPKFVHDNMITHCTWRANIRTLAV